ncbi:uncharacterized protein LOC129786181 isoform X1 [Lutzomyia longipalpis]|uniref:uncharacterized protein LOC129786181 isoform X1 n=1 Tax=Lutzomyia longipalpis TaxID=7200 RepID=UPI0024839581|nr:uncharacterized protein LOC129786181 isoform X1 [Lutzomyia longipalpis]
MLPLFKTSIVRLHKCLPIALAKNECGVTLKYFTLKELKKVILKCDDDDRNDIESSAKIRSKIAYDVSKMLVNKPSPVTVEVKKEDVEAAAMQQPEAAVQQNYNSRRVKSKSRSNRGNKLRKKENVIK